MNKFLFSIAALAALSTASFAERGDHGSNRYGADNGVTVSESRTQAVYTDEETSSEGLTAFQRYELLRAEGAHEGNGNQGDHGARR